MKLVGHGHKSKRTLEAKRNRGQRSQRRLKRWLRNAWKRHAELTDGRGWRKKKPRPKPGT